MSVNSSSFNSSLNPELYACLHSKATISIFAFIVGKSILFFPLSILVLYLGHQQRRRCSSATTNHFSAFTFHSAAVNLIGVFGSPLYLCALYSNLLYVGLVGFCCSNFTLCGETLFNVLTCVDRYLAVVHPITYLGLKKAGGVRIRNISIGCVWLLSFGCFVLSVFYFPYLPLMAFFCLMTFSFIVVSFCCLSVLRVLIRPGPQEGGGERERVDQSKRRAFHTILAIMGVLWLWFVGSLVCLVLSSSSLLSHSERCLVLMAGIWCELPGSLILPLLFLRRVKKCPFCSSNPV